MPNDKHGQEHTDRTTERGDKHQGTLPDSPPVVYGGGLVIYRQYYRKYIDNGKINI